MTEHDYIAEYVKERCPEMLDTVDFNRWRLQRAYEEEMDEAMDKLHDRISKIWGILNKTESEREDG